MTLHLISHYLCPYVQRAAISLAEKGVSFDRTYIDLSNKPDWFLKISPLGKTPVLVTEDTAIFESAVILEYLEDTQPNPLHPKNPLARARDRAWVEFGSAVLNDIAGFYNANDFEELSKKSEALSEKFARLETEIGDGPYFNGAGFSLVDAVFGPVFRYFDVFDLFKDFEILGDKPKVACWRAMLAKRPSILQAVSPDYANLLIEFLIRRNSHLSKLITSANIKSACDNKQDTIDADV